MSVKSYYKCCAVPYCGNTNIKTPTKLFIHVPSKVDIRKKWLQLAGVSDESINNISAKSNLYFCEDHFDLPKDMENYMEYHLLGFVKRIIMKPTSFPSRFPCHSDLNQQTITTAQDSLMIDQLLQHQNVKESEEVMVYSTNLPKPSSSGTSSEHVVVQTCEVSQPGQVHKIDSDRPKSANKSVQAYITKKYRSKSTLTHIRKRNSMTSPIKVKTTNIAVSPLKIMTPSKSGAVKKLTFTEEEASESEISSIPDSSLSLKSARITSDSSANEEKNKAADEYKKDLFLQNTLTKIKNKPRFYIGVPKSCYFLIKIIEKHSGISEKLILLCLKKIKLNTKFEELADEFGMTKSYASKTFRKNIPIIAYFLSPFIVNLDPKAIKSNLPIAFRHKYHEVLCIIDCLEIEIEKPSKALHQALTWSQYKKGNTVKYLISCSPDGLINYISPGYGGRISDTELVENCNYLDSLPPNTAILADRGFKHLEPLLINKGFRLFRPPSVPTGSKLTKKQVKQTKEIASLRIHVERVIRRVREFTFLKPHAVVNIKLIDLMDEIITIACGLINLQDSIIKK